MNLWKKENNLHFSRKNEIGESCEISKIEFLWFDCMVQVAGKGLQYSGSIELELERNEALFSIAIVCFTTYCGC